MPRSRNDNGRINVIPSPWRGIPGADIGPNVTRENETMRQYHVYIMNSGSGTLNTGVTNDLARRVQEHKSGRGCEFTRKHRIRRLAYDEATNDVKAGIEREKQIKGWSRAKKLARIKTMNPTREGLSADVG